MNCRNIIIHTYLLIKLTGPNIPSTPSLSSPGQEDWPFCTNFSPIFISVIQYITSNMHFPNIFFIYIFILIFQDSSCYYLYYDRLQNVMKYYTNYIIIYYDHRMILIFKLIFSKNVFTFALVICTSTEIIRGAKIIRIN